MKCSSEFVFRGLERKDGGKFTNERGQEIKFEQNFHCQCNNFFKKSLSYSRLIFLHFYFITFFLRRQLGY